MTIMLLQRCVLITLLSMALVLTAAAESPILRPLGPAQGLPSGRVLNMAQDRSQRIWIATVDGLARFDGQQVEVFRFQEEQPESLPGNVTQVLMVDSQDRLWVGLEGLGVVRHLGEGRFERPPLSNPLARVMDAWALAEEAPGRYWIGGFQSGVLVVDEAMQPLAHYASGEAGLLSDTSLWLKPDRHGAMWVAGDRGLQRWNGSAFETAQFENEDGRIVVFRMLQGAEGLLVATSVGAFAQVDGLKFRRVPGSDRGSALALLDDQDEGYWIGSVTGLQRIGPDERLNWTLRGTETLGAQPIADLMRDREGGLWIATDGGGAFRLPPHWRRLRSWLADGKDLGSLPVVAVTFAGGEALYTADIEAGLLRIDLDDGQVTELSPANGSRRLMINGLIRVQDQLWLAHSRGLRRFDLGRRQWLDDDNRDGAAIHAMSVDAQDRVWLLNGEEALELHDSEGRRIKHWPLPVSGPGSDSTVLRQDEQGSLWVAGRGVLRVDPDSGRIEQVIEAVEAPIEALALDGPERLWLAQSSALLRFDRGPSGWQQIGSYRLPGSVSAGDLWVDAERHVWVSSPRGLLHFDPLSERFQRFGVMDGLPSQVFREQSIAADGRQRFAAITDIGVLLVAPNEFEQPLSLPELALEPISWQRQGRRHQAASDAAITLEFDDRDIRFAVRALSFANPETWRYRHRLHPFDPDWVELGSARERLLSSLPPGDYRWQVEVAGPWTDWRAADSVEFRVRPPWWAQPWARLLQGVLVLLAAWSLIRVVKRRAQQRAQQALRESERRWALQANEQKTKFVQTLAHELRTPMTGVMGMAELLSESPLDQRQREQIENLRRAGDLLLRHLNETLDLARIEAGSLELREQVFSPPQVLEQAAAVMRPLAQRKQLSLLVETGAGVPDYVLGDADRVQQILLNLLGNAIKFTERGGVCLRLEADAERLHWQVADSGPGLSAEQQSGLFGRFSQVAGSRDEQRPGSSGLGLNISRELASLMGGELGLESVVGQGTTVHLSLPLRPAAAPPKPMPVAQLATVSGRGMHVLLVEDDPEAAAAISGLLELQGSTVDHASTPLQALSLIATSDYQLGLLDLDLPGMDGSQLAQLMRAQGIEFPLWAVTARLQEGLEEQLREVGIAGVVAKPVEGSRLNSLLSAVAAEQLGDRAAP